MKHFEHFWMITLLRGILAVVIGCAVIVVPDMAVTLLLLPFAVAFSVLGLALYGILDSVLVLIASFNTDARAPRITQRIQSVIGMVVGILLLTVVFEHMRLHWFFYLIGAQVAAMAVVEFFVGMHLSRHHGSRWMLTTGWLSAAAAIGFFTIAIFYAESFSYRATAWALYSYLLAFGITQCILGASMLYMEPVTER